VQRCLVSSLHYFVETLRWSWHFPWQVLSAEKRVGWLKMFLIDALHKMGRVKIKTSDTELEVTKVAGR